MELIIRHQEERDLPAIGAFFKHHDLTANTSQIPYNRESYWQTLFTPKDSEAIFLVAELDSKIVGHMGIFLSSKPRRKHVASFAITIHPNYQGKGIGSQLMEELINLCDNWLNIVRTELTVYTNNEPAIALYKKYGFEIEGTTRCDCFYQGRYLDSYQMARINAG